ncbi:Cys-tRNA(Pro) deacylase [Clostridium lacusfryxellense]|uniref:Cys-tRNA(Pro) deacylase n=1 Tax=Clostridium lacusfryxellense TaxID=205328 RepID=UPI001C0CC9F3|nr:Cys-tRNA(Pro) deacylase [Clostridium lacusfryxellense]MBU3113255.1 Cys-tRNA(Pro) deacylase [Clostridium lacusfryxellense]
MIKTNVMRILDKMKVEYGAITYDKKDDKIDGVSVAKKIGRDEKYVYKTLVTMGSSKTIYVILIPVREEIDFKKAGKATNEKKIEMLDLIDLQKYTGYVRGGCSPIGMKKQYKTLIDKNAVNIEKVIVSGGKIGYQVEINVVSLRGIVDGQFVDLIK